MKIKARYVTFKDELWDPLMTPEEERAYLERLYEIKANWPAEKAELLNGVDCQCNSSRRPEWIETDDPDDDGVRIHRCEVVRHLEALFEQLDKRPS